MIIFLLQPTSEIHALSHSSGISSGCMAEDYTLILPRSGSFGAEFIVSFHLWLGIPVSSLYVCLTTIENSNNHLLEYCCGFMRIICQDALFDIVCHSLLQSHPGVLKEQQVSR